MRVNSESRSSTLYPQLRNETIPQSFFALSSLERLYLSDNDLAAVGAEFGLLGELRILALRNNRIARISANALAGLVYLKELHLQGIVYRKTKLRKDHEKLNPSFTLQEIRRGLQKLLFFNWT